MTSNGFAPATGNRGALGGFEPVEVPKQEVFRKPERDQSA